MYGSLEELLDDPRVDIVDVAVPGVEQKRIALAVADGGSICCARSRWRPAWEDGREIVAAAKANGVQLAVNMNGRWDPALRAAKSLIEDEFMGAPRFIRFEVNGGGWPSTRMDKRRPAHGDPIQHDPLHRPSALLLWRAGAGVGDGHQLSGRGRRRGDRMAIITMEFPEHLRGLVIQDCYSSASPARWFFQFEGTEGVIEGEPGWHEYPNPRPSTIRLASRRWDWTWAAPKLAGCWLPDGWLGTMTALQQAVVTGRPGAQQRGRQSEDAGAVFAIYDAIDQRRVVELGGVAGSRAAEDRAARRKSDPLVSGLVRVWLMPPTPPLDSGPVSGTGHAFAGATNWDCLDDRFSYQPGNLVTALILVRKTPKCQQSCCQKCCCVKDNEYRRLSRIGAVRVPDCGARALIRHRRGARTGRESHLLDCCRSGVPRQVPPSIYPWPPAPWTYRPQPPECAARLFNPSSRLRTVILATFSTSDGIVVSLL